MICATAFSVVFSLITGYLAYDAINNQQSRQANIIKLLVNSQNEGVLIEPQRLLQPLTSDQQYTLISVTDFSNKNLYTFESNNHWLAPLFAPQPSTLTFQKQQLRITFQTNSSEIANNLVIVVATMVFLSLLLVLLAGKYSVQRYRNIINSINQQIKNELTHVMSDNGETQKAEALFDLPELNSGLNEIKQQINNHIEDTGTLKKDAYIDSLTQLENRTKFVQFFESKDEKIDFGVLTITRCSELQTINKISGYSEGDNYIRKVTEILLKASSKYQSAQIFRLNSSDFATIFPNTTLKDAEGFAQELTSQFNEYQQASDIDSVGYTGLVAFDQTHPLGELLALADTGISVAQTKQMNAWYAQTDTDILESSSASYGNQNWRQEIDNVLENQRVNLLVQHIKPTSRTAKVYSEVLARFLNSNKEMLPTASFIAMAEKLDKIVEVDRMIIEQTISEIANKNLMDRFFGINISPRTIHDDHFLIWLERRLLKDPAIASNLVFEISEYGLQQNIKTSKRFVDMVHRTGARVTVERFGVGLTSFKFFRDLKPDFIKMDSTYTHDIDEDKNNQYFLRLMVDLAHRLSITVLAESVETQEEKFTLEKLFIDGCQGFYIGRPEPI